MQQVFKNVWDRKSKPEIVTDEDWAAPIDVEWPSAGVDYWITQTLDEVQCPPPDNSVQQDLSEYFEL